jgi:hypothetical protein
MLYGLAYDQQLGKVWHQGIAGTNLVRLTTLCRKPFMAGLVELVCSRIGGIRAAP